MEYVAISDLAEHLRAAAARIPRDVELIVGIPRSGVLAASILALHSNLSLCDLPAFLQNGTVQSGKTREVGRRTIHRAWDAKSVLVVDDSLQTGAAMDAARSSLTKIAFSGRVRFAAIYVRPGMETTVDFWVRSVRVPRYFEWNLFHRRELSTFCVDIDGVLCRDPSEAENDDGVNYARFLQSAALLTKPTYPIGHLVTSRLERYRGATTEWLQRSGIAFRSLHMLDLPSASDRRRLGVHGQFKAQVYQSLGESELFIESSSEQSRTIADLSGKPVLDFGTQRLVRPGMGLPLVATSAKKKYWRLLERARSMVGR